MAVRNRRDPWRIVWQAAVGEGILTLLLLVAAAALALAAWVPQVSPDDAVAYARAMSSLQARFGNAAQVVRALGLLSIAHSWGFRILMASIAGCVLLRAIELSDRVRRSSAQQPADDVLTTQHWLWSGVGEDLCLLVAHIGALLLACGLLVSQLWGWQRSGVIVQSDARVALPGHNSWVALNELDQAISHSSGVRVIDEEWGPGASIRAVDGQGQPLGLQQSPDAEPAIQLSVALAQDPDLATRDAFVAVPEAQLIVRLLPETGPAAEDLDALLVQVYRSPSGELAAEAPISGQAAVPIGDVALEIESTPYVQLTAVYSPGVWPTVAGVLALAAGLLATVVLRALATRRPDTGEAGHGTLSPAPPSAEGEAN